MQEAELILTYLDVLAWPAVAILIARMFKSEVKSLFSKALDSHEVEIDVLGQKIKLKALEQFAEEASSSQEIEDAIEEQHNNDFLALHFARLISSLSTQEVIMLRHIARNINKNGYAALKSEEPILTKFVELEILDKNERGFYITTEQGHKLLHTLKNL